MSSSKNPTLRLNQKDNVIVAISSLKKGHDIPGEDIICLDNISEGHKLSSRPIRKGEHIYKYGHIIGIASRAIKAGEHVHTHNMDMVQYDRDYAFGTETMPTQHFPEEEQATFQGLLRPDGRVATRNYVGVMASVSCSSSVTRFIAEALPGDLLSDFPNVDGVLPIIHDSGCGIAGHGDGIEFLQRTLKGWADHSNFGGLVLVGHGCEINQIDDLMAKMGIEPDLLFYAMNIQDSGGTRKTIEKGVDAIRKMLPKANDIKRQPVPASHLLIGLECGGSDAFSGITANPALGVASDLVVRHGGAVILSETTEIYGAEQLLTQRIDREKVGMKLLERIRWWEEYTRKNGVELNNQPSPGNKAGGLTTILEKSLGAVAKSGSTNLQEVYGFAEPVTSKGLVFMDTPGYDMVSVTGMVAGGANLICFTTGRGSVYGSSLVPTIKLASNSKMYRSMEEDMDINCGLITDGEGDVQGMGEVIFQKILDTASGEKTRSELLGFGENEFQPWHLGVIL